MRFILTQFDRGDAAGGSSSPVLKIYSEPRTCRARLCGGELSCVVSLRVRVHHERRGHGRCTAADEQQAGRWQQAQRQTWASAANAPLVCRVRSSASLQATGRALHASHERAGADEMSFAASFRCFCCVTSLVRDTSETSPLSAQWTERCPLPP